MGTIAVSLPADGTTAEVADYNTPITTIVDEINGNLDNANIATGAAIAGSKLADDAVTADKIDWASTGAGGGIWWEELGRHTLGSAADVLTVASFPARKYLRIYIYTTATGGTTNAVLTFNSDTGSTYSQRISDNFGAASTATSNASLGLANASSTDNYVYILDIVNVLATNKLVRWTGERTNTAGAGTAPELRTGFGKWANTAAQITTITSTNTATGDYASGSEMVILGHD